MIIISNILDVDSALVGMLKGGVYEETLTNTFYRYESYNSYAGDPSKWGGIEKFVDGEWEKTNLKDGLRFVKCDLSAGEGTQYSEMNDYMRTFLVEEEEV